MKIINNFETQNKIFIKKEMKENSVLIIQINILMKKSWLAVKKLKSMK